MILSNVRIQEALDNGWLKITPEPTPRHPSENGDECPYQTSAVDLRLGNEIIELDRLPVAIDLREGEYCKLASAIADRWTFPQNQPYTLVPNKLVLAQTLEKITHDSDRDFYLSAEQAVEYGLVDEILKKPEPKG